MSARAPVLVLGLGNELFTDEGVGVAAARAIEAQHLSGVDVVDGGTLGLGLLPELEGRDAVLVLDAIVGDDCRPGEIIELGPEEMDRPLAMAFSAHQLGITESLAAAKLIGRSPANVSAVGMVPFSLETGHGLSEGAREALGAMVERALSVLASWGYGEGDHA